MVQLALEAFRRIWPGIQGAKFIQTVRRLQDPVEAQWIGLPRQIKTYTEYVMSEYGTQP
jgi:hypothetical protein